MKDIFYIVVGNNGIAIVRTYDEALSFRRYFNGHVWVAKETSWMKAQFYAHKRLVERVLCPEKIPEILPLYQCITRNKLENGVFDSGKGEHGNGVTGPSART